MTIGNIRSRAALLFLMTWAHLIAADKSSKPVQVETADKLHQSAIARQNLNPEDSVHVLKTAYEGRLASLGATNPKTIESLEALCEGLLKAEMAVTNIAYFRTLVETSSKTFAQTSEQVLQAEDYLLTAEAAIEAEKQNELRLREQLAELGLNVDPAKLKEMTPEEVMRLLQSTPQGRLQIQKAELQQRQNEIAATEAMQNPAIQGMLEAGREHLLQSLRDRGYSEVDSQRLLQEYQSALASNPAKRQPGENPIQFQQRMAEVIRTNPAALGSPQLRTNPLNQPWKPQDPRNIDRRLLETTARTDPQKYQRFLEAGLVRKYARDPKGFCEEQLQEINRSFDSGTLPGYIIGFRRLEIPASALEDPLTMASISACLKGVVMHRETSMLHGPAEPIDAAIADYLRMLGSTSSSSTEPVNFEELSKTLTAAIWKPVAATFLADTRQVFLSPDSELNRVPFPALFDGSRFVAEDIIVRLVSSCRELLTQTTPPVQEKTLSLWGDASFGVRGDAGKGIKGLYYGQLPYSRNEIETIGRLASGRGFAVSLHAGKEVTEDSFMQISSPRFLHIATHGIILPLPRSQRTNTFVAIPAEFRREMDRELLPYRAALGFGNMNPGLDSWTTTGIAEPRPDGLLTGFEASQLVLNGTELVTLSACDSGSGAISPGEGVFSIRRSFHLAGSRQVVASLWQVNDKYAPEFFEKYYVKLFTGTDPASALKDVQAAELKRLRTMETGGSLREAVRLSGPFLISGFSPDALRN